jgi:hypothetical protein
MTTYLTGRDVMARVNAPWHAKYTIPTQWDFYVSDRSNHGAYFYDWTTDDEVAWRNFYRVWMQFLNDYKNMGGRVTASSDAGFIYNTPGFSTIQELELLQEAGFYPGEAIRAGTLHAAQAIFKPRNTPIEYGVVEAGDARRPGDRRREPVPEPEGPLRDRVVPAERRDRGRSSRTAA